MRSILAIFLCVSTYATVVDRIAIVTADRAIKDSDIEREIRVVSFLNREKPDFSPAARKKAAQRLIDQTLIRRDIEISRYAEADPKEVDGMYNQVRKRYSSESQFQSALSAAGITKEQLRRAIQWQMTVLRYIEQRFRPATVVNDKQVRDYYLQHRSEFRNMTLEQARPKIQTILRGDVVNQQFYAWLDQTRKQTPIRYIEGDLR
jgi:parvulin-like peptidyl-prolyl isomerase